jgi:hypothetical protein
VRYAPSVADARMAARHARPAAPASEESEAGRLESDPAPSQAGPR